MSALMVTDEVNFNDLKQLIDATDGNLATHLRTLEDHQYIRVQKWFIVRKTNTTYSITPEGSKAFRAHLDALEAIIRQVSA